MAARVERVITSGTFSIDGEDFQVDNNIWLYGDDDEVVVIDAAHDHAPIADAVGGRRTVAIVCTHGHNDHINAAVALAEALAAKGITVDRKQISVDAIKIVGEFEATARLHKAVKATTKFSVPAAE